MLERSFAIPGCRLRFRRFKHHLQPHYPHYLIDFVRTPLRHFCEMDFFSAQLNQTGRASGECRKRRNFVRDGHSADGHNPLKKGCGHRFTVTSIVSKPDGFSERHMASVHKFSSAEFGEVWNMRFVPDFSKVYRIL